MKKIVGVLAALGLALAMPLTAAAAEWKQTSGRWWYSMDGGRYPVNGWMWIDGDRNGIAECYYFDQAGYILQNTLTPDHCRVNGNGAWVDYNGRVYTRKVMVSNSAASAFQTEAERQEVLRALRISARRRLCSSFLITVRTDRVMIASTRRGV